MKWFSAIGRWLTGILWRKPGTSQRVGYLSVDELPDTIARATIYVVGERADRWAAAMLCPCGCGDVIELNLLTKASPCWDVREHKDGTVSLFPSVWRTKGCRSHFSVRHGRIEWHAALTQPPAPPRRA